MDSGSGHGSHSSPPVGNSNGGSLVGTGESQAAVAVDNAATPLPEATIRLALREDVPSIVQMLTGVFQCFPLSFLILL
jgi:hypothetical protein